MSMSETYAKEIDSPCRSILRHSLLHIPDMQSDPNQMLSRENLPADFGEVQDAGHLRNQITSEMPGCISE